MISVNVARLKEKLSHYLKLVKEGQEVVVTSHHNRVARILPSSALDSQVRAPTRPVRDLKKIRGIRPRRSVSAVARLAEDRRRR